MVFSDLVKNIVSHEKFDIVRRYVITNSYDATIAILGIILAHYILGTTAFGEIQLTVFGVGLAMCVSGISSVYLTEMAEKRHDMHLKELALARKLSGTAVERRSQRMIYIAAGTAGFSPFLVALIILVPFTQMIAVGHAARYAASFLISAVIIIFLGYLMGFIANANRFFYSLLALSAGFVTVLLVYFIGLFVG
jgi:predicted membrane protein (TIGR00267 family)